MVNREFMSSCMRLTSTVQVSVIMSDVIIEKLVVAGHARHAHVTMAGLYLWSVWIRRP